MLIAIAAVGKTLDDKVDMRFGRCPYFLIVDSKTQKFEVLENTAGIAQRGAGISAAQLVVNKGVKTVIAGNFGPKAINVLSSSGIDIYSCGEISIKKALADFKNNKLPQLKAESFPFMRGMGGG